VDPDLGPNLIDGGFESTLDGWSAWGGAEIALTSAHAATGVQSALVTNRTGSWQGPVFNLLPFASAGKQYRVGAWLQALNDAAGEPLNMTAKIVCDGATEYRGFAFSTVTQGAWTKLEGDVVVPACNQLTELVIYAEGPRPGVDMAIDDVSVREVLALTGDNLIANSGFEAGVDGWTAWGGAMIAASSLQAHTGAASALVTNRTGSWQGAVTTLTGLMLPGKAYDVNAWLRLSGAAQDQGVLTARISCAGLGDEYRRIGAATVTDSAFTEVKGTIMVPACELTGIDVYAEGPQPGVDLFVDDVSVRELL
jgi:hypothetical protein